MPGSPPIVLEFRRITADAQPSLLENLIRFEAVHRMQNWRELQRRLKSDRRCYGLFQPDAANEPVIFTEVALTTEVSEKVQPLLDPDSPVLNPGGCDCAIFYSISNCHDGYRGMGLGGSLIRKAVESLCAELPQMRTFATLSPIPGFREWLEGLAKQNRTIGDVVGLLNDGKWMMQPALSRILKRQLIPLCSYYLLYVRNGTKPADAVARFHLGNGARLERVNWQGDVSDAGLRRSVGFAANYRYSLKELQRNQESYVARGTIAASRRVERWATLASCAGREPVLDYRQFGVN
ncbi:MAG TPA: malonyl-CoA decarboxylase family protein [Vicinamibacterales bacterium]